MRSRLALAVAAFLAGVIPLGAVAATATSTFVLTMDEDPQAAGWWLWQSQGSHEVKDGRLYIEAPSYYEFFAPPD